MANACRRWYSRYGAHPRFPARYNPPDRCPKPSTLGIAGHAVRVRPQGLQLELPGNDIPCLGIRQVCTVNLERGFAAIQLGDKQRCPHIARLPGGFGVRLHNGGAGIGLPCQALGRFYHGQLVSSAPHQASQQPCHGGQRKAGRPALGKGAKRTADIKSAAVSSEANGGRYAAASSANAKARPKPASLRVMSF